MTPERKKYLTNIPWLEQAMRNDIQAAKDRMKVYKMQLTTKKFDCIECLNGVSDGYFAGSEQEAKDRIRLCKVYIKAFKRQLPQRLPEDKLKACPFCGSKAEAFMDEGWYWEWTVCCQNEDCIANSIVMHYESREECIEAWNRRNIGR